MFDTEAYRSQVWKEIGETQVMARVSPFCLYAVCALFFREFEIFLESVAKKSAYLLLRTIFVVELQSENIST